MSTLQALQSLLHDDRLAAVLSLVALDLVVGITSAVVARDFKFSRVSDFLFDDVVKKVIPWMAFYVFGKMGTSQDIDVTGWADLAYGVVIASLLASLTTSAEDLGLPVGKVPILGSTLTRSGRRPASSERAPKAH